MTFVFFLLFSLAVIALLVGLIKPAVVVRWGSRRTRGRTLLVYGGLALIFLVSFTVSLPRPDSPRSLLGDTGSPTVAPAPASPGSPASLPENTAKPTLAPAPSATTPLPPRQNELKDETHNPTKKRPHYKVVKEDISSSKVKHQIEVHLIISGKYDKEGLTEVLEHVYAISEKKLFGSKAPKALYITAWTEGGYATKAMPVGWLHKNAVNSGPTLMIDEESAQASSLPSIRFGLTEEQRKDAFLQIASSYIVATAESDQKYPHDDNKAAEYFSLRMSEIKTEVYKKYDIDDAKMDKIYSEGKAKGWPEE